MIRVVSCRKGPKSKSLKHGDLYYIRFPISHHPDGKRMNTLVECVAMFMRIGYSEGQSRGLKYQIWKLVCSDIEQRLPHYQKAEISPNWDVIEEYKKITKKDLNFFSYLRIKYPLYSKLGATDQIREIISEGDILNLKIALGRSKDVMDLFQYNG